MKKILYVVLHGSANSHRYHHVMNTWGKNVDVLFYSDSEDLDKKIIKVSDRTDYRSAEDKHVNVFKFLYKEKNNYEWFFFCDDDTFVNTPKMDQFLVNLNQNEVYGSVLSETWPDDRSLKYCSGGAGYLIHRNLLVSISDHIKNMNTGYSDVTLGLCLREMGIIITDSDYFKSQSPEFYNIDIDNVKNYITFHYIKNMDYMLRLHNCVE
jgi:hypothetical protein